MSLKKKKTSVRIKEYITSTPLKDILRKTFLTYFLSKNKLKMLQK